jgi:hypothetical protein
MFPSEMTNRLAQDRAREARETGARERLVSLLQRESKAERAARKSSASKAAADPCAPAAPVVPIRSAAHTRARAVKP